jgi:hypothetical protein
MVGEKDAGKKSRVTVPLMWLLIISELHLVFSLQEGILTVSVIR